MKRKKAMHDNVVRHVSLPWPIDESLKLFAEGENRTISNALQILVIKGLQRIENERSFKSLK